LEGLDAIRTSPRTAAVTNLMVDHLNRYPDMASYMDAKRRIFIYQGSGDVLLLNRDEAYSEAFATTAPGRVEWFNPDDALVGFGDPGSTWGGSHNLANANCAAALARSSGIAEEAIAEAIRGFAGVPYRQEVVRVHRGVRYINDTAATTPDATVAALSSVSGPIVLLLGGADKGLDFTGLVASLADPRSRVTDIVLLEGSATDRLVASVGEGLVRGRHRSFPDAVTQASQLAGGGAAVLLSPGCASFGMFVNEFDRGDQFNALVHALG
jgi:UDP-N-acetylmuramoylalanine--D-glutamate ligase